MSLCFNILFLILKGTSPLFRTFTGEKRGTAVQFGRIAQDRCSLLNRSMIYRSDTCRLIHIFLQILRMMQHIIELKCAF